MRHLPAHLIRPRNLVEVFDVNDFHVLPVTLVDHLFSRQIAQAGPVERGPVVDEADLCPFAVLEQLSQKKPGIASVLLLVYGNTGGIVLLGKTIWDIAASR